MSKRRGYRGNPPGIKAPGKHEFFPGPFKVDDLGDTGFTKIKNRKFFMSKHMDSIERFFKANRNTKYNQLKGEAQKALSNTSDADIEKIVRQVQELDQGELDLKRRRVTNRDWESGLGSQKKRLISPRVRRLAGRMLQGLGRRAPIIGALPIIGHNIIKEYNK